tara:strand:- start:700 stop:1062 length:363 start_codon:yes stop_codon:yes gene_type:complete
MTTKDELVANIKGWIKIDNEMKLLQQELKQRRDLKKQLTESLVDTMKKNEIDCFNMSEGKIIYTKNKVKAPLSKKHLIECLEKYFSEVPNVEASDITDFIMENREIKYKENIRHKVQKNM